MARKAHPWYWAQRNGWYVNRGGKRHFLGEHPDAAPRPRKSMKTGDWNAPKPILETFHQFMGHKAPIVVVGGKTLAEVFQGLLHFSQGRDVVESCLCSHAVGQRLRVEALV